MDHHSFFYRGREGGGAGGQFPARDSLDLSLHLAPPTPPYPLRHQPSRSETAGRRMFNFLQSPPMWIFLDTTPPSPGEIDLAGYHHFSDYQQSPFWGMDLTDIDASQDLDLDFSFLHEDEEELEVPLVDRDHDDHQVLDRDGDDQEWWDWRGGAAVAPHSSRATTAEAPQSSSVAASASPAKSQSNLSKKKPAVNCAASASSPDSQYEDHLQAKHCEDHHDRESQQQSNGKDIFFDCNVCFDVASEPVVTSCGHLFCWPCLYQWLHVHSNNGECPVCKGAVLDNDVIPIYGRGGVLSQSCPSSSSAVPPRPRARRADSMRQEQPPADVVLGEMLRWRQFMRMWRQRTSRLMLERRGRIDGGLAPELHGMIDQLHHQWPYNGVATDGDARM